MFCGLFCIGETYIEAVAAKVLAKTSIKKKTLDFLTFLNFEKPLSSIFLMISLSQEKAYVYLEEYCSVVDLTKAPTYLDKLRTDEVLKSLKNELKQVKK